MLAQGDDITDCRLKLLLREFHLAGKIVQVADKRRQNLPQTGIFAPRNLAQYRFGDVFLVFNNHRPLREPPDVCGLALGPRTYVIGCIDAMRQFRLLPRTRHIRPSSRSSRRNVPGMAATPLAALSRSRGASLKAR